MFQQVEELLQKGVIEGVVDKTSWGLYSRFFVVLKRDSDKWWSILDLSHVNRHCITKEKFQMDTLDQFRELVNTGDFITSINLSDAYFHVLIHPSHRKYLSITLLHPGEAFQLWALTMGMSS